MEVDPSYCDQIVRRFEDITGKRARLAETGQGFEDTAKERARTGGLSTAAEEIA